MMHSLIQSAQTTNTTYSWFVVILFILLVYWGPVGV
jgi:hypothetical protein